MTQREFNVDVRRDEQYSRAWKFGVFDENGKSIVQRGGFRSKRKAQIAGVREANRQRDFVNAPKAGDLQ